MHIMILVLMILKVESNSLDSSLRSMIDQFFTLKYETAMGVSHEIDIYEALFYNDDVAQKFHKRFLSFEDSYAFLQAKIVDYEQEVASLKFETKSSTYAVARVEINYKIHTQISGLDTAPLSNTEIGRCNPYRVTAIRQRNKWKLFNLQEIQPPALEK